VARSRLRACAALYTAPMRFAFVMDPIERILPDKDTTFVLMLESGARGHEVYYLGIDDMWLQRGVPHARVRRAAVMRPTAASPAHHRLFEERETRLDWFDAVFMRKDPPFDMAFFFATHLLCLIDPAQKLGINDPRGLRDANEKLYALYCPDVIPPSLVTSNMPRLKQFLEELGGEMIVKPLDGAGGAGVFHLHRADRNLNSILEAATEFGRRPIMAQRYLPEIRQGDKRIILIDGRAAGALRRVPQAGEARANLHVGARPEKATLSARDLEICARLAPRLRSDGVRFAGLDVIGDWLTEVNVTSPTGIQEINALDNVTLQAKVIDFVERRVAALHDPEPEDV
jgi:glutathione synthase